MKELFEKITGEECTFDNVIKLIALICVISSPLIFLLCLAH